MTAYTLDRRRVLALAWPIVLAQMATAATGVVDTAVMGRFDDKTGLAAVAIAAVAFSFIYWGFGFLRMATTGLTAQAEGAGDAVESRRVMARALILGGVLGVGLLLLFPVLRWVALSAFQAPAAVEDLASDYFAARIPGAPAALMGYGVMGWLIGVGRTRALLAYQVVANGTNAALDVTFVAVYGAGPAGIGAGTAIAEWVALFFGLWLVRKELGALRDLRALLESDRLKALFAANRDVMIRTLALLFAFAWFINSGAQVGTAALAGNQVLLQFVSVSAFVLDAFAFVTEREVGAAFGAGRRDALKHAVRITTELALVSGLMFCAAFWLLGAPIIDAFVSDDAARAAALEFLPWCAVVPLLGVPAWQLDGVFLGATQGRALRTAAVTTTVFYVALDYLLSFMGNEGVWWAFLGMYVLRALTLGAHWPALLRATRVEPAS